eukprot:g14066.t1
MTDHHRKLDDTFTLVGALMRLRHNTKFKGGGVDLGEAPRSVASPREHVDFLRLLSRKIEIRQRQGESGGEHDQEQELVSADAANFAEAQIRALVNSELEACLVLHETEEFWQQRLDRPGANLLNWIEMGPWTWWTKSRRDCLEYYLRSLSRCRHLLRIKILSTGSLQLHLTQMKQAYMEGTLDERTVAALAMIRRTLDTLAVPIVDGDGAGDGRLALQQQLGEEEPSQARADFDELLRDAQAESRSDIGIGIGPGTRRGRDVMGALLETSEELVQAVEMQQKDMVPLLLGRFAAPSRTRRNWMFFAVATPAVVVSIVYMYKNRNWMQRSMFRVRGSFWQFVREHISEPFWGIYNELVHNQPLTLTDANALADSSNSLERMLEAFIKDTKPNLSQEEVKKMAMTGDMSVVSREYERSIINAWKNFVAGDIVRMMLIQVQFIKRELLIATTALGQLARENELNLRMMATVPAFLVAWGSFRAVRPVYYWLKSEKSRESTFTAMRTIVLAMERLLNLRHREGTWLQITADQPSEREDALPAAEVGLVGRRGSLLRPAGYSDNCTREVLVSAGRSQGRMAVRVLDELDLGKLMMLVHQLLRLIRSGPRRFPRRDVVNLREDLAELVGERGLVSVGQQLRIVQRVQRSYNDGIKSGGRRHTTISNATASSSSASGASAGVAATNTGDEDGGDPSLVTVPPPPLLRLLLRLVTRQWWMQVPMRNASKRRSGSSGNDSVRREVEVITPGLNDEDSAFAGAAATTASATEPPP